MTTGDEGAVADTAAGAGLDEDLLIATTIATVIILTIVAILRCEMEMAAIVHQERGVVQLAVADGPLRSGHDPASRHEQGRDGGMMGMMVR